MNILLLGQSNAARWFSDPGAGAKAFSNRFAAAGVPVNLINAAVGGTSLLPLRRRNWLDNSPGSLYSRAIQKALSAGKIDAAIWIQGEADSKGGGEPGAYGAGLETLFGRLRKDLGDIPVYMQPLMLPQHLTSGIREAQLSYATRDPLTHLVQPRLGKLESLDGNHFTNRSYKRIAKKFANHIMRDFSDRLTGGLPISSPDT